MDNLRVSKTKIDGLEIARFLFSLAVLLYHYFYYGPLTGRIANAPVFSDGLVFGRFAVEAFFVISGFVIVYSAQGRSPLGFAIARLTRLWPAMFVCATVTFISLKLWPGPPYSVGLREYISAALLIPLAGEKHFLDPAYWSIAVELKFYFAIFLLLLFVGRPLTMFAAVWTATSFAALITPGEVGTILAFLTLSPYSAFFIFGILLYCRRAGGGKLAPLFLMVPAFFLGSWQMTINFQRVDALDGAISPWWTGAAVTAVIFASTRLFCFTLKSSALSSVAARMGGASYPLYLLHQSLGMWAINYATSYFGADYFAAAAVVVTIAVVGLAFFVSEFVEPLLRPEAKRILDRVASLLRARLPDVIAHSLDRKVA